MDGEEYQVVRNFIHPCVQEILVEYESILEQLRSIKEESERLRDSKHKLQEGVVEQQRMMREEEEESNSIRDLEIKINSVKTTLDTLRLGKTLRSHDRSYI